jgi:uncharacterized membrane protein YbaN (DUF454 family)
LKLRRRPFAVVGAILIAIGIAGLVHPQFSYRASQHTQQIGPAKIEFETRKVYHIPIWFSVAIATIGAALAIAGLQKEN